MLPHYYLHNEDKIVKKSAQLKPNDMQKLILLFLCVATIFSCSSSRMVQQYKNPETASFEANKVLVIGLNSDKELRAIFEESVVNALEQENIRAVKSIDFFESSFTSNKRSIAELNSIENQLLNAGFDAILFAKVTGKESRVTVVDSYRSFAKNYQTFEDYYLGNQHHYFKEQQERYKVYTTETSLYCICSTKERELLWRGEIEVVDTDKVNRNISSYINILFKTLKEDKLLLIK